MKNQDNNPSIASQTTRTSQQSSIQTWYGSGRTDLHDLDDPQLLPQLVRQIQSTNIRNFLVTFDDAKALVLVDGSNAALQTMLRNPEATLLTTRWLSIFKPQEHTQLLESLAQQYDFAPRLLAEMCSSPQPHHATDCHSFDQLSKQDHGANWSRLSATVSASGHSSDRSSYKLTGSASSYASTQIDQKSIYSLADEIWHYTTIDFGRNYICCGYNTLYGVVPLTNCNGSVEYHLPACTRVWNWLIITDDGTIITITEDVLAHTTVQAHQSTTRLLETIRRNLTNVLRSLSLVDSDPLHTNNRMTLLPIRARLGSTPEETLHRDTDAPGLLFFYLFDSWHNSYSLITRKESRYGLELELLRKSMLVRPRLDHMDRLHRIGQELGVLKRHYTSYNRLIDRLLAPRPTTAASLQNSRIVEGPALSIDQAVLPVVSKESSVGVSLSTATRVRFQRLRDQIDLYALSEIDEYLAQKDSLVSLNFNLLALRESLDVEKLTRITLLLTKATILFLPVSFMASYFSIQLIGTEYTVTQFWVSFVAIFASSLLALFMFGILSGTAQTAAVMDALGKGIQRLGSCFSRETGRGEKV